MYSESFNICKGLRLPVAFFLICWLAAGSVLAQSSSPVKSPAKPGDDTPSLTGGNVEWSEKYTTVNFSVEKKDKLVRELTTADIEAYLDGEKLTIASDALTKSKESDPVKVLFVIDRSGSMISGTDKLAAAKDALRHFISKLNPNDQISLSTFAETTENVLPLTKKENFSTIDSAIDGIVANGKFTLLYDAVDEALRTAEQNGIKNILFLSDGKEDRKGFKELSLTEQNSEKRQREGSLTSDLNKKGIRFFSVAIGDPNANPETDAFVDYESMKNISTPTQGVSELIDLPKIDTEAGGNSETKKEKIADRLKETLAEMKKLFKFAYSLRLDIPKSRMKDGGNLELKFNVSDGKTNWKQSISYPYTVLNGVPAFSKAKTSVAEFIVIPNQLNLGQNLLIYSLLLVPLLFLSMIPPVINLFTNLAESRRIGQSIMTLRTGSNLIGGQCPNEGGNWGRRFAFREGDTVIICPSCRTPHHLTCWEENKSQCMSRVCGSRFEIPANVLAKHGVQTMR